MNKHKSQSGFAHLMILVIILILALIGTLGFVYWQNFMQKKDDSSITPASSDTSNDTSNNTKAAVEYKTYTNSTDKYNISFQYPSSWALGELVTPSQNYPDLNQSMEIKNDSGEVIAELILNMTGLGGTCEIGSKYTVLEAEPTSFDSIIYTSVGVKTTVKASLSFTVIENGDGTYGAHYGLTDTYTTLGEGQICRNTFYYKTHPVIYEYGSLVFGNNVIDTKNFSSMEDARQYMNSDEYKAIKKMILSLTY